MNLRQTFCLAALTALCGSSGAQSSSVTLFGIVDTAVRQVRNDRVGSITSLASGANQTSRFGVRGSEDLGGGLSAGFWLESALGVDAGTAGTTTPAGQFWDRRSTVSLVSSTLGEVRLGRDFVPTYSSWGRFDPFGYVGLASSSNFITGTPNGPIRAAFSANPNTTVRASNAVQYVLPNTLGGVEGNVMVAAGEGSTSVAGATRYVGGRLAYVSGPLILSAAYGQSENELTGGNEFKDSVVGASYDLGVARLAAAVRRFEFSTAKQTNLLLAAVVPVGSGAINLSWNRADQAGRIGAANIGANDANQYGVGYVHNLSKRTVLYGTASLLKNKGGSTFTVPGGPAGLPAGGTSKGVEAGMRHAF